MAKRNFIQIQTIVDRWNGSTYDKVMGDKVWIDPSIIVEVYPLKEGVVYDDVDARNAYRYGDPKPTKKYAYIYRSTAHGHGINGMSTEMMVDEESYEKIVKELGID